MVNGVGGPNMELAVSHVVAEKQRGRASVTVLLRQTAGKSARASPLQARSVTRRSANKVTLANEASTRNATVYCIYKTNRNKSFPSKVPSAYPPHPPTFKPVFGTVRRNTKGRIPIRHLLYCDFWSDDCGPSFITFLKNLSQY